MVGEKLYKVRLSPLAKESFKQIIEYIRNESSDNAIKVRMRVNQHIKNLNTFPRRYRREPYLADRNGEFRSFGVDSLLIIYQVESNIVTVLDIVHSSRNPVSYLR